VKDARAGRIALDGRPQIEGGDSDQGRIVAIGLFGKTARDGPLAAVSAKRDRDQLRQRAGKIALIDDGRVHPRRQGWFRGCDRDSLALQRIPERVAFRKSSQAHDDLRRLSAIGSLLIGASYPIVARICTRRRRPL